jgi:hypothetical protein
MARRLVVLVALLLAACGKSEGSAAADGVIAAWQQAGLETSGFEPVDGKALGDGACKAGTVRGVVTTLCEYRGAEDAKRAEAAGLAQVRDATGLALAEGKLLLVLADRDRKDPSGKTINEIARSFRNR